jgi:putative spermidine/putrescine transport system ATP-binding protein
VIHSAAPAVELRGVRQVFGPVVALDGVSFAVGQGEFFGMLGPSGSGKTTCLRLVAGFDQPTAGEVLIEGEPVAGLPPHKRKVHTVFQDYALFPHLSVADNVAFALMIDKVPRPERMAKAEAMLERVKLGGYGKRKPSELSGGQRQRVALARALIDSPSVLLLDEPLGALDLKLREEMQVELKALQRAFGITFIFVTHDQGEALGMSDRLIVFNKGRIEQIGTPREIYETPRTAFVASFVGSANVIDRWVALESRGLPPAFAVRPERVHVAPPGGSHGDRIAVSGTVIDAQYLGSETRYGIEVAGNHRINAAVRRSVDAARFEPGIGALVQAVFAPADIIKLEP